MTIESDLAQSVIESPDGITLSALAKVYPDISRRMLQRHLKDLVDQQSIVAVGNGRGRRYRGPAEWGGELADTRAEYAIAFAEDSQEILRYVKLPLASRTPVGYQFDFLDEYQPNKAHYLSASLRQQLFKMGRPHRLMHPLYPVGEGFGEAHLVGHHNHRHSCVSQLGMMMGARVSCLS